MAIADRLNQITKKDNGASAPVNKEPTPKVDTSAKRDQFISKAQQKRETYQANPAPVQQPVNQPQNGISNRSNFKTDDEYEKYIVGNKLNATTGDAYEYISQKAKEQGIHPRQYFEGMRNRYKDATETEKFREGINSGKYGEKEVEEINNRFGVLLDENGNEADVDKYNSDTDLIGRTAENIQKAFQKNEKDYTSGKIDYQTYANENNRLVGLQEENNAKATSLQNYKALNGFDYYDWAKENGKDVSDFESYVESMNDWWPERLAEEWTASWVDTLNILPQTYNVLAQVIDPNYDSSKSAIGSLSDNLSQTSQELREYVFAGADPVSEWSLQCLGSLMPMINSMMVGNLLPVNTEAFTNVALGLSSGVETTKQRLQEGVNPGTAVLNGVLHGVITGMVEGLNMGEIPLLFSGVTGAYMAKVGLMQFAGSAVFKEMMTTAINEGKEEIFETLLDWGVDNIQNMILGSIDGNRINATELDPAEMANEFIMASVGTVALGIPTNASILIDTKRRYNGAMEARKHFESVINNELAMPEERELAKKAIEVIDYSVKPFEEASQIAKAVDLQEDMVKPAPTYNQMINNLANAIQPDVSTQLATAEKTLQYANKVQNQLQEALIERNIFMPASEFINMDPQTRTQYLELGKQLSESGREAWFADLGEGVNGYNSANRTFINTRQTGTIDVDSLVNMDEKSFNDIIKNDVQQIFEEAGAEASAISASVHEFTHFAEQSGKWNVLRDYVKEQMGVDRFNTLVDRIGKIYDAHNIKGYNAEHEAVAYYIQKNMGNMDFLRRLVSYDNSLFNRLATRTKNFFSGDTQSRMEQVFMDAFRGAKDNLEFAGTPAYSIGSLFQAVDMTVEKKDEHTFIAYNKDGELVRELTEEDVKASPLGKMIEESARKGFTKDYDGQIKMMTELCNQILSTDDADMIWALSGSIGFAQARPGQSTYDVKNSRSFSAFTKNADNQYGTTFDVITICTKTQQLIDVASALMKKLGRGLTEREIIDIVYDEVYKAKEPVPCPVCYVFSRWVGLGGVLDNIQKFQEKYKGADLNALRDRYETLMKQVDEIAKKRGIRKSKAQEDLRKEVDWKVTHEYENLYSKDVVEKMGGEKMSAQDRAELESLKKDLDVLNDWSWITRVLLEVTSKNGVTTIKLNQKYLENGDVPPEILFDLNKGEDFSKYSAWNYRKTRGARYGKTISPYSDMVLGQTVMGVATPSIVPDLGQYRSAENNPFLNAEATEEQKEIYKTAVKNARIQNLKGGSRAQSTSDFRFEFVTDYLLHFLQLQSIGSYGQTYTKVPEAVPMLASVGYEVNMSLMPRGMGYVKAKKGEPYAYYVQGFEGVEDGWYKLDFSSETGINPEEAFYLRKQYDNAQTIMVGINDVHNYLSRLDPRVDFIIPYHASGGTQDNYKSMMNTVHEAVVEGARFSYEDYQNDVRVKNPTVDQQEAYDLRIKILTGNAENLTEREMKVRDKSKYLSELWRRFYEPGYDEECFSQDPDVGRVVFSNEDAKMIYPYEYWDKTSTRKTADVNGIRFADYCKELGIIPRFSQWVGKEGYWKCLIDRSMYNLDGSYHYQQAIKLDNFNSDFLYKEKMVEGLVQPKNATKEFHKKETPKIVNKAYGRITGQLSLGATGNKDIDAIVNEIFESMSPEEQQDFIQGKGEYATTEEVENDPEVQDEGLWVKEPEGDYIKIDDGYMSNGKTVAYKDDRIRQLVDSIKNNTFYYPDEKHKNVYILNMSPHEYRSLSYIFDPVQDMVWHYDISQDPEYYNNNVFDPEKTPYRPTESIGYMYFIADVDGAKARIIRQEGNHRSIILDESGYTKMPILLFTDMDLYGATSLEGMNAPDQETNGERKNPNKKIINSNNYLKVKSENLESLIRRFGSGANADVQYSLGARKGMENLRQYVENNPGSKYEEYYNNMKSRYEEAQKMFNPAGTSKEKVDEIYNKTGWLFDELDGVFKGEFYDDESINKLVDYVLSNKGIGKEWKDIKRIREQPTIGDILGDDNIFTIMYPELKNVHFMVSQRAVKTGDGYAAGWWWSPWGNDVVMIAKRTRKGSYDYDSTILKNHIAHELQHFIQDKEKFSYGNFADKHDDRPGEKEADVAGETQANEKLRKVDNYGNMIANGNDSDAEIPNGTDEGNVDNDGSTEGDDAFDEPGEVGDSNGLPEEGEDSEGDSGDSTESLDPDEEGDNLTDNLDDDGEEEDGEEPASIKRGGPEQKKPTWERFIRWVRHHIGDHLDAVEDLARRVKNRKIIAKADTAMNFRAIANNTILNGRYNLLSKDGSKIGESLSDILNSIPKGLEEDFDYYMYHYRNMDSTSLRERMGLEYMADKFLKDNHLMNPDGTKMTGEQFAKVIEEMEKTLTPEQLAGNPIYSAFSNFAKAKYVFGTSKIGYNESKQFVEDMEAKHPEFKKIAERIWEYGRMDLQVLRDAGIISQDDYDMFLNETPHYVPIARDIDTAKFEGKYKLDPNKAIRRFKGSTRDMWSLEYALINHTYNVYRSALTNNLHQEIYDTLKPKKQTATSENVEDIINDNHTQVEKMKDGTYRMYAYINGKRRMVKIDEDLYNSLSPRRNNFPDIPLFTTISEIRRNLITSWNPVFYATNAIKDVQDALYNTKYFWSFGKNYVRAWNQILSNGEYKQMYLRNGGEENSYMHELNKKDVGWKPLKNLIAIGDAIELAPRMAEFISSIEAGNSVEEAMLDASEITTNFKRGGDIAKTINRNGVTFFNASVQGFNKQVRNFKDARDGGAKAMATYMARIAFLSGIPLFLLNHLVWKDDDDYEGLSDYIKENYYIIGKVGNRFIRIPKGRLASFYQTAMTKGGQTLSGQVKAWDALMDVVQSGIDNIAPNNPTDNFIGSPLIQAYRNKTWYGDDLVPSRLQKYPDEEQYDYSTDVLSIFLGQKLKISPYKINYVLDQYSGGIGDIGLPMLSLQADNGINNKALASLMSPILDKFTTDPVMKAQAVSSFYELKDATQKLSNSKNATDEQVLSYKYLSAVGSEIGELYSKMREIQADPNLSNGEKYAQVRELKEQINQSAQEALASYDSIDLNGGFADVGGVYYRRNAEGGWSKVRDTTLKKINEYGLSDEEKGQYFDSYYDIENARDEVKANTPEGENADYRQATIDAIRNSNMDAKAKNAMFDSYYSGKFNEAVNAMDLSDDEKLEIKFAKTMAEGTKDANGKTIANSKAQAVADAYRELGVLDDVLKYISDNDIEPSVMGLSKTVYNQLIRGGSYKSSGSKSSSRSSKKASSAKSGGGGSTGFKKAGKLAMVSSSKTTAKPTTSKIDNYFKAYANVFNRSSGGRKVSTGGSSASTCPRCGSRVPSGASVCPVCGQRL